MWKADIYNFLAFAILPEKSGDEDP